ncbi:MAG: MarR family winged helix-turn-helix transcriptional regulator [Beutenbergiaceae bacterium]
MTTSRTRAELLQQLAADQQAFAVSMARHRLKQLLDQHLSAAQLHALVVLDTLGDQPSGELARQLHVSAATTTGLVDRLVRDGFAQRHPDPDDGRTRRIHATEAGRSAWRNALLGPSALNEAVLQNLRDEDLELLIKASAVVQQAMVRALVDQEPDRNSSTQPERPAQE